MIGIKVEITRFISNDQPGWIECKFKDAWNEEHVVEEKVPVITTLDIGEQSIFPLEAYTERYEKF